MNGYIKYFENGGKNMSFMIKDSNVLDKYNKIWNVIENKIFIKFHSEPIYDQTYIKAKVREFDGVIKTNFLRNGAPKVNMHYTCYKKDEIVRPLCIILPSMNGYNKYFENGSKNMSFFIKDDDVLYKRQKKICVKHALLA